MSAHPMDEFVVTEKHVIFHNSLFSNWYMPSEFYWNGLKFLTSEHYMMYQKAILFNDMETAQKILDSKTPRAAKALGREVKNFVPEKWDECCMKIVKDAIRLKFTQHPEFRRILVEVGKGRTFVEGAPKDPRWGIGIDYRDPDADDETKWKGTNWLGICLTQVCKELSD